MAGRNPSIRGFLPGDSHGRLSLWLGCLLFLGIGFATAQRPGGPPPGVRKVPAASERGDETATNDDGRMRLHDRSGNELDVIPLKKFGRLLSVRSVADGREFGIPIENLSEESARAIEDWTDSDLDAVSISLAIEAASRVEDSLNYETADGRSLTTKNWTYDVWVHNRSLEELEGARLEYRIYFDDKVELRGVSGVPGKGRNEFVEQSVDLPPMKFNDKLEFATNPVELHRYEFRPRNPRAHQRKELAQDVLIGLWIRIRKGNAIIAEYFSDPDAFDELRWTDKKEPSIEIRDPFRDRFGP